MRILHVITTLDVGGAEMHLLAQVRGQCVRGHSVRVVWLKGEGRLAPDFRAAGAEEVVRAPLGPLFPLRLDAHLRWCDLVHTHLLKADMATAVVATLRGKRARLVASKHNDEQVLAKDRRVARVHGVLGNLPARTIVLSDHVRSFFEHHGGLEPERMRRIYYGIDPEPFEAARAASAEQRAAVRQDVGYRTEDLIFTCVARFAPQKAHDVLLRGFALARERAEAGGALPPLKLLLVGDDPFGGNRTDVEVLARQLGLVRNFSVRFTGIRRDVPAILGASDVFVLTSRWEGLGLVFLEAMAAELPVLATRVSAVPEVVRDGETGRLVPPDDPEALATAMLELAADEPARRAMGAAGRARVREHFGLERMVEETLAVYDEVLGARPFAPAAAEP